MREDKLRLDKWLWFARVVKSRTLATRLVEDGHVRVNGQRCVVAAKPVGPGDVLTIALERQVRVLRIVALGERRVPFEAASRLFEELAAGKPAGQSSELRADPPLRKARGRGPSEGWWRGLPQGSNGQN